MITKNVNQSLLLNSLNESREDSKKPGILHLDGEVLHATQASLVVLLIETSCFYINNQTKLTAFQAPSFYLFSSQLPKKLDRLCNEFSLLKKPSLLAFTN